MRDLHLKIVLAYAVSALALLVGLGIAFILSQTPVVPPEAVTYATVQIREVGGNEGLRAFLGFAVLGAGLVSAIAAGFGFHASKDRYS